MRPATEYSAIYDSVLMLISPLLISGQTRFGACEIVFQ